MQNVCRAGDIQALLGLIMPKYLRAAYLVPYVEAPQTCRLTNTQWQLVVGVIGGKTTTEVGADRGVVRKTAVNRINVAANANGCHRRSELVFLFFQVYLGFEFMYAAGMAAHELLVPWYEEKLEQGSRRAPLLRKLGDPASLKLNQLRIAKSVGLTGKGYLSETFRELRTLLKWYDQASGVLRAVIVCAAMYEGYESRGWPSERRRIFA